MHSLKKMIGRYMQFITICLVIIILVVVFVLQTLNEQRQARENAHGMIVQIEQILEENKVLHFTGTNELSYIFRLLKVNVDENFYAIDAHGGEIIGATTTEDIGKHITEIGFDFRELKTDEDGFHADINGIASFCVFEEWEDLLIGRVVSNDVLYQGIPGNLAGLALCFAFLAIMQIFAVTKYMNRCVVNGIHNINKKLRLIATGNLDEHIDVKNSLEFVELSTHINDMVKSILDNNKKMSYVLSKTNLFMGIYEYNEYMKKVRYTEYVPKILDLNQYKIDYLASDYKLFAEHINKLKANPVSDEDGIFLIDAEKELYVRLEEITENNAIFGVLVDVSEEMAKRKQIEAERDIDALTGLYNRRGIDCMLASLFQKPDSLKHGALVMIDADGLKQINDKYGHDKGDIYLKKIGHIISSFGLESCVASRQGGDEYVLFLYHYDSEEELLRTLETLRYIQNNSTVHLDDTISVPLRFSFGYCLTKGRSDYPAMLKEADEKMYANKLKRKSEVSQATA